MAEYKNIINNKVVISGEKELDRMRVELKAAREETDRLQSSFRFAREQVSELERELQNLKVGNGIDILEEELRRFKDTAQQSLEEFKTFLQSVNLNDVWGSNDFMFDEQFRKIRDGSITASQAIMDVKTNFRGLMEENYNSHGGVFDSQMVQGFSAALERLGDTMGTVIEKLERIETEGVKSVGAVGGGSGGSIVESFKQISEAATQLSEGARGSIESVTALVGALDAYAGVDSTKLLAVSQAFRNIAEMGTGSFSAKSVENIIHLATQLSALNSNGSLGLRFDFTGLEGLKVSGATLTSLAENLPKIAAVNADNLLKLSGVTLNGFNDLKISSTLSHLATNLPILASMDTGKIKALSGVDLSKFNELKISKTLDNLGDYLGKLASIDVANLKKLSAIDFTKFNDINISKATVDNITKLYEAMGGSAGAASKDTGVWINGEKKDLGDVNKLYEAHKAAVDAAVQAEAAKAKTSRILSADLDKEKVSLDGASKSAKQEATFYNQLLSVTKKYAAAQKDIAKLDPEKNANEYQIVSEALQKYKQELDELNQKEEASNLTDAQKATIRQIYEDAASAVARYKAQLADTSAQKAAKQASEEAAKAAKEAAKEQEKAAKAAKTVHDDGQSDKDLAKKADALRQINDLIQKCTEAEDKYALAGKGKFNKEYTEIVNTKQELIALKGTVEGCTKVEQSHKAQIKDLARAFSDAETTIKTSGNALSRWWSTGLTAIGGRLTYTLSMLNLTMKAIQGVKKMISTAVELDTAMNQLQVVTRSSKQDMDAYADSVSKIAKETAQSTKDMIEATTVYARLGYTMDESSVLAKYTAMLQGVGDIDASAAQDAMTAIIKAFKQDVGQIESIMDKMVVVGNNFPISVSQIAEGMNNAGSALAASGNSLDQSIALLTAANTTVQNVSKSSTGLRTIAARIRKTTVELDDLGETVEEAKYQKVIDMLTGKGVDFTVNGEYRSTYDILKSIAGVWSQLSSMEKAGVAEQLAGTRQQNVFFSIIEQFQEAEDAMARMGDSAGELQNAFGIYMDSIQAHVNQLKAAFEKLSMTFVNSDFAKGAVDFLTKVLESLTGCIDKIGVLGTLLGGTALVSVLKMLSAGTLVSNLTSIVTFFKEIAAYKAAMTASGGMAWLGTGGILGSMAPAIASVLPYLVALAAAVGTVTIAVKEYRKNHPSYEDLAKSAADAKKSVSELEAKIKSNEQRIEEINQLKDESYEASENELNSLVEQNERYEEQLALLKQIAEYKQTKADNKKYDDTRAEFNEFKFTPKFSSPQLYDMPDTEGHGVEPVESGSGLGGMLLQFEKIEEAESNVKKTYADIDDYLRSSAEKSIEEAEELFGKAEDAERKLADARAGLEEYQTKLLEMREVFAAHGDEASIAEIDEYLDMIADASKVSEKSFNEFTKSFETLDKATQDAFRDFYLSGKGLSEKQIDDLRKWHNETGYVTEDIIRYFRHMYTELDNTSDKSSAILDDSILDLVSLRDELGETSQALQEYNDEMAGGDYGDSLKKMAAAYKKAMDDMAAGKVGARSIKAAGKLLLSDDLRASLDYDAGEIGRALHNSLFSAIFSGDEDDEDYGVKFANYIRENAKALNGVAGIIENTDGTFDFWYNNMHDLAEAFGVSDAACGALLATLQEYDVRLVRGSEDNGKMIDDFVRIYKSATDAREGVEAFIRMLMVNEKADDSTISQVLQDLQKWGYIQQDIGSLGEIIQSVRADVQDLDDEDVAPSVDLIDNATDHARQIDEMLRSIFAPGYQTNVTLIPGLGGLSSAVSGVKNLINGGSTSRQGAAKALGGPTRASGETLVNELGPELISDEGKAYIANNGKPGFTDLSKDAIVFNAEDTKKILGGRYSNIPVRSLASGTTRASLRDRLLSGKKTDAMFTGGVSATFTCEVCGYSWRYGLLEYPNGITATCPKCGARYKNGKRVGGGNKDITVGHENDDYYPYYTHESYGGAQIAGYDDIWQSYIDNGSWGPQDSNVNSGVEHQKKCPHCGSTTTFSATTCKYCGYNFVTGEMPRTKQSSTRLPDLNTGAANHGGSSGYVGGGGSVGHADYASQSEPQKVDWIAVALNRVQRAAAALEKVASSGFKKLSTRASAAKDEVSKLTEEIEKQQAGMTRYEAEAKSVGLSESIAALVRDGTIDIQKYDEETRKLIDEYSEWYEKALDCKDAVEGLHQEIADLYVDMFNNAQTDFENQLKDIEHAAEMTNKDLSMIEAKGYLTSAERYEDLVGSQTEYVAKLKEELASLQTYFNDAMNSHEIEEGSEAWYEMKQEIDGVKESIADANVQLVEYQKTIRDIGWQYFDYMHEQFGKLTDEANFLINVMANDKLFDDRGQFSEKGMATVGMRVLNYNSYMEQADSYAQEMQRIQRELASDPYNKELIERRNTLISLQRQSIEAAEGEKDAVKDLVSQGIQLELSSLNDLINAYEESLDSAKDLYEYQKKVMQQTGDIAALEKQLSAYQNDTSEENRARVQKLQKQLRDARENLQETEYEQSISDQKKLLGELYDEYEEFLNKRLDDVDVLMEDMIEVTNANLTEIRNEINDAAAEVGYSVTDEMRTALSDTFANYSYVFEDISSVHTVLTNISANVSAMARASGAVKAYAKGGLIDYTGLAAVHGTPGDPEMVLSAADTKKFLEAAAMMRGLNDVGASIGSGISTGMFGSGGGIQIGTLEVNIPIGKVLDYNDMLAQMQKDPKFDRLINAITLDRAAGKSSLGKYGIRVN